MKKERYTNIADKHVKDAYGRDGDITLENGDKFISGTLDVERLKVNGEEITPSQLQHLYRHDLEIALSPKSSDVNLQIGYVINSDIRLYFRNSYKEGEYNTRSINLFFNYISDKDTFTIDDLLKIKYNQMSMWITYYVDSTSNYKIFRGVVGNTLNIGNVGLLNFDNLAVGVLFSISERLMNIIIKDNVTQLL